MWHLFKKKNTVKIKETLQEETTKNMKLYQEQFRRIQNIHRIWNIDSI